MEKINFIQVETPTHIEAVEDLAGKIWPDYYQPIIGRPQVEYMLGKIQTSNAIQEQINQGSLYYLIRDKEGLSLGYVAITPKPLELFLSKLYLLAGSRGKGYGWQTMDFVKKAARDRNLSAITLTVHKQNPSVRAYEKMGFKIVGQVVTDIGAGYVMDDFKMEFKT